MPRTVYEYDKVLDWSDSDAPEQKIRLTLNADEVTELRQLVYAGEMYAEHVSHDPITRNKARDVGDALQRFERQLQRPATDSIESFRATRPEIDCGG